ncbi:DUF2207 domain-containing protein [bacterium]|nr:DUF2207 domain-containing protein [bacterium]
MKIKNFLLIILALVSFFSFSDVQAEEISDYKVEIQVNQDSAVNVKETIIYDFGDEERHGIYRDLPYKYKNSAGSFNLRYKDFSVKNEKGDDYNFSISRTGDSYNIRIGDEDVLVTGKKEYVISYTVNRAITYFSDHDEFYWNAVGTEWNVPIAKATVIMNGFGIINTKCYLGKYGEGNECPVSQIKNTYQSLAENVGNGNGITIVMGFNKGLIYEPTQNEKIIEFIKDNWGIAIPFLVLIFLLWMWLRYGRDPKGKGVIIAQYSPLPNLSPIESKAVMDESVSMQKIAAEIITLAVKKYITIEQTEEKTLGLFKSENYTFKKVKNPDAQLTDFQLKLMEAFFSNKDNKDISQISTSEIKDNPEAISKLITLEGPKIIYKKLTDEKYFPENPQSIRLNYIIFGILVSILCITPMIFDPFFGWVNVLAILISGILIIFFGFIMPRKTIKGVQTTEYLLGLKKYISVAEAERIKFHNAPAKKPEHFEELLPYAIIFDLEKEWAKKFEGMEYNPSWYSGTNYSTFNTAVFVSSMNNLSDSISQTMTTASSGGSGFSGGGAGGGFGGGGGGSW